MAKHARRYGESTLADQRDPRWKAIRKVLHENKIGCRFQLFLDPGARCMYNSVVHNRAASLILDALDDELR